MAGQAISLRPLPSCKGPVRVDSLCDGVGLGGRTATAGYLNKKTRGVKKYLTFCPSLVTVRLRDYSRLKQSIATCFLIVKPRYSSDVTCTKGGGWWLRGAF